MADDAKHKLVAYLEQHAFQPVLHAKPDSVPAAQREKLEDVQRRTRSEIERFRAYGSAAEVVTNFKRDLHSSKAREVHRHLSELGLPTLNDVREEFEALAGKLGVQGGS